METARHRPPAWTGVLLALALAAAPAGGQPPAASSADSTHPRELPFLPAGDPGEPVTASKLTRAYSRDIMRFISPVRRPPNTDLELLDQLGPGPVAVAPDTVAGDSSEIRLTDSGRRRTPASLTPEEKAAASPPSPGATVAIPSAVAATGALVGGLALLVKILLGFLK